MLTGSYTAYAPPTSGIVFPTAPLVNPTAPPSTAYTSFLRLCFDSQGFPIPPWETYGNYHQRPPEGSAREYVALFEKMAAQLVGIQEEILEGTFIKGLKPELRTAVRTQQPKGVTKAIQLTLLIDENKSGGECGKPETSPLKKRSPEADLRYKAKGLCFCCDGQFAPSHKYPEKYLQVMAIYDGETDEEEEEQEPAMEEQIYENLTHVVLKVPEWPSIIEGRTGYTSVDVVQAIVFRENGMKGSRRCFESLMGLPPQQDHEHAIVLKEGTEPISVRPYRFPQLQKDEIKRLVNGMSIACIVETEHESFFEPTDALGHEGEGGIDAGRAPHCLFQQGRRAPHCFISSPSAINGYRDCIAKVEPLFIRGGSSQLMSKKVAEVNADLAQFKADVTANQEHNKQIAEETRQRLDDMKEAIDRNAVDFAETSPGFATQPMLTGSYTAYVPPTSGIVFPTAPLVNPTTPPLTAYTSFLRLRFDSQGFPIPPWETYDNYHQRPPPSHEGSLYEQFLNISQEGSAREYVALFEKIAAQLVGIQEEILEGTFIKGLKPELRTAVRTQQPKGVTKAIQLTLLIDENKSGGECGKSSNFRLGSQTGGGVPRPTASHTRGLNSKIVAGAASKPPFKRMSEAEFADKKAKGLCFRCDGQFPPGHKCPEKSLQVMVIYDGETDEEEEEHEPAMEEQIQLEMVEWGDPQLLICRVGIYFGVTGDGKHETGVRLGNGKFDKSSGLCRSVVLHLPGLRVVEDFYPLELGSTDVILAIVRDMEGVSESFLVGLAVMRIDPHQDQSTPAELDLVLKHFSEMFEMPEGLPPQRDHEHAIVLKGGTELISVRPYRYPQLQKDEIKRLVREMVDAGIVRPSTSPFSSPIVSCVRMRQRGLSKGYTSVTTSSCATLPDVLRNLLIETDALGLGLGGGGGIDAGRAPLIISAVLGSHVVTDQKSLKFLLDQRVIEGDHQRWISKLSGYDFEIVYRPGKENGFADALSRRGEGVAFAQLTTSISSVHSGLEDELRQDSYLTNLRNRIEAKEDGLQGYSVVNGVVLFNRRVVLPQESPWVEKLFQEYHGGQIGGYRGTQKTYQRLASEFYWTGMKVDIAKRVAECDVFQRNKSSNLAPAGLLQPLNLPERIWEDITMDFVEGLPRSEGFSVVFVVVDRLSKSAHFIPLKHPFTAASVAGAFIREVVRLHGIPQSIVSDRDKVFLSLFWREIFKQQGTVLKRSTAYHPQTDGQTKVVNRSLEIYLRCFTSQRPEAWVKWLPWAEYWYNTSYHLSLRTALFHVLYGQDLPALLRYDHGSAVTYEVDRYLVERDELMVELKGSLLLAQQLMKQRANGHRRDVVFNVGDRVYLKMRLYRQLRVMGKRNEKLSPRYYGLYRVLERVGEVAYKLQLPEGARIHLVFHVSQLKRALGDGVVVSTLPVVDSDERLVFAPAAVLDVRENEGRREVLIAWQGMPPVEATWEGFEVMMRQFPSFHLEDKVGVWRGDDMTHFRQVYSRPLGWLLEEIHVTWAHLEKKRTRLRLYTNYLEEKHTVRGDGIANYKRQRQSYQVTASKLSSDGVMEF
ncbi:ty3-gypsy retrotransposon protein [Tanacetum coccineum]|uniref:Ty3-gypsy retrotransposon protein n=1 Tax=Tanacetum coccineum TaxID=301880 RepID=A0ABQ4XD88_9ASTR